MSNCILAEIDYEEAREFLPPESVRYLDDLDEDFRRYAMNQYHRLIYTKQERNQHYHELRDLGYKAKQAVMLADLDWPRLKRILDGEIEVVFVETGGRDKAGAKIYAYSHTVNLTDSKSLNNFRNIDKGYIHPEGGRTQLKEETCPSSK